MPEKDIENECRVDIEKSLYGKDKNRATNDSQTLLDGKSANRRSVLKSIGAASVGTTMMSSLGAATTGTRKLKGITYDTLTQEFQGPASAKVTVEENGGVSGIFQMAGFKMALGEREPLTPSVTIPQPEYEAVKQKNRHQRDGLPLKLRFTVSDTSMDGTMTRPSGDYGRLGFKLVDPSKMNLDLSEVVQAVKTPLPNHPITTSRTPFLTEPTEMPIKSYSC